MFEYRGDEEEEMSPDVSFGDMLSNFGRSARQSAGQGLDRFASAMREVKKCSNDFCRTRGHVR
jgi:hypothetical protein